jgi:hypothetical protein
MKITAEHIGRRVIYSDHAGKTLVGEITSLGNAVVFVKFNSANGEACEPSMLDLATGIILAEFDQERDGNRLAVWLRKAEGQDCLMRDYGYITRIGESEVKLQSKPGRCEGWSAWCPASEVEFLEPRPTMRDKPEHIGDGLYVSYNGDSVGISVNDHKNEPVAWLHETNIPAMQRYLARVLEEATR